jgi:hypothetical protein
VWLGKGLTEAQRARWVTLICRAADDVGLPADAEFRAAFVSYLEWTSRIEMESSQPGAQPPEAMPAPHWQWIAGAAPGTRTPDAPVHAEDEPVALPGPDEPVSFSRHIKPLFRPTDRQSMQFIFDLWSHQDVTANAASILARLREGSMPCDGGWPADRTEVFARWVEAGTPE